MSKGIKIITTGKPFMRLVSMKGEIDDDYGFNSK